MTKKEEKKYLNHSIDKQDLEKRISNIEREVENYIIQNIDSISFEELYLFKRVLEVFLECKIIQRYEN